MMRNKSSGQFAVLDDPFIDLTSADFGILDGIVSGDRGTAFPNSTDSLSSFWASGALAAAAAVPSIQGSLDDVVIAPPAPDSVGVPVQGPDEVVVQPPVPPPADPPPVQDAAITTPAVRSSAMAGSTVLAAAAAAVPSIQADPGDVAIAPPAPGLVGVPVQGQDVPVAPPVDPPANPPPVQDAVITLPSAGSALSVPSHVAAASAAAAVVTPTIQGNPEVAPVPPDLPAGSPVQGHDVPVAPPVDPPDAPTVQGMALSSAAAEWWFLS